MACLIGSRQTSKIQEGVLEPEKATLVLPITFDWLLDHVGGTKHRERRECPGNVHPIHQRLNPEDGVCGSWSMSHQTSAPGKPSLHGALWFGLLRLSMQ